MPRYLLDTNIVIYLAKGRPGSVREQALAVIDTLSQRMRVMRA